VTRYFPLLLAMVLLGSFSCSSRSPEETVASAIAEAQAGRLEAFLSHFEPESRQRLALFWAVSTHYGYLEPETLSRLGDLAVEGIEVSQDLALVTVRDSRHQGTLTLHRIEGEWKIALPRGSEVAP
jgi:hypothetical protein